MWIKAKIIGFKQNEIETDEGKLCLTDVYIIDADNDRDIYSGLIIGDKFHKFRIDDVVTFEIIGFNGKGRRVTLSLAVQNEVKVQEVAGEGVLDARQRASRDAIPDLGGAMLSNTAPPKYK